MKYVAFIESNASGTGIEAIKKLKTAGFHVIFLTNELSFYQKLDEDPTKVSDIIIEVNTSDIGSILASLVEYKDDLKGIVAFDDYRTITAATVAKQLNLPHANISALVTCRFKNLTRKNIISGNVNYKVYKISEEFNYKNIIYPCVVKPCDDSGSVGVKICQNELELKNAIDNIKNIRVNARGYQLSNYFLIEEFIEGKEYSAELVWDKTQNKWNLLGITRKILYPGVHPVEIGHDFPIYIDNYQQAEESIIKWINESQLTNTVAHLEFMVKDQDFYLIEINPRCGGGMIHYLCEASKGVDLVDYYLSLHVLEYEFEIKNKKSEAASVRFYVPPKFGKILAIDVPKYEQEILLVQHRTTPLVLNSIQSSYDRIGYVIAGGKDVNEAAKSAQSFLNTIKFDVE